MRVESDKLFFKILFPLILSHSPVFRLWTLRCSEKKLHYKHAPSTLAVKYTLQAF